MFGLFWRRPECSHKHGFTEWAAVPKAGFCAVLTNSQYIRGPAYKTVSSFGNLNLPVLFSYLPNLALWGGAVGAGVATFTEGIPLFQKTFYQKIPVVGDHWVYNPDPEDIPV